MKNRPMIFMVAAIVVCAAVVVRMFSSVDKPDDVMDSALPDVEVASLPADAMDQRMAADELSSVTTDAVRMSAETMTREAGTGSSEAEGKTSGTAEQPTVSQREQRILAVARLSRNKPFSAKQVELIVLGMDDTSSGVRATAVTALGRSKSPDAIVPLVDALMDQSLKVRQRAHVSLRKLIGIDFPYKAESSSGARQRVVDMIHKQYVAMAQSDLKARLSK